jgi:hypothetical protein
MHVPRPALIRPRPRLPAFALSPVLAPVLAAALAAVLALAACAPAGPQPAADQDADECGAAEGCDSPVALSTQVRLDTEAMLAGMAHARARLGLQEDATP